METARLVLRRWREDDLEPFAALNADPEVTRFLPAPLDRAASDALARRADALFDEVGYGLWAIEVPGVAAFVGFTGLNPVSFEASFTPAVEVGWRLTRGHWGKGYATEAARVALDHGFREVGMDEIVSFTTPGNTRSQQVMRRIGLRRDPHGDFDHPRLPAGDPLRPHVLYRGARADWSAHTDLPIEDGA
ncbi:MAG: GNAT family N-acetyltransferase [Acidimicrobiia bacterium]|nr:GNAT family N-acetyltransferase [Acidimicrobiia bacterium]